MKILLIGSQSVKFLIEKKFLVIGIDNHMRSYFFGESSSTKDITEQLLKDYDNFIFNNCDIRDFNSLEEIFIKYQKEINQPQTIKITNRNQS